MRFVATSSDARAALRRNMIDQEMTFKKPLGLLALVSFIFISQACVRKPDEPQTTASATPTQESASAQSGQASVPVAGSPSTDDVRVFRGSIGGKHRIEMRLVRNGDRLSGTYAYEKVGTSIDLKGAIDKQGHLTLQEFDTGGKQTGVFKGKWNEDAATATIEGDWRKPNGGEASSFYLTEQHVDFSRSGLKLITEKINEDNRNKKYTIDAEYPQINGSSDYHVEEFNQNVKAMVTKEVTEWKKGAGREPGEKDPVPAASNDYLNIDYNTTLATDDLISIQFVVDTYAHGAAHGSQAVEVVNYSLKSGKPLRLADLFKPQSNYLQAISTYCIKDLKKQARKDNPQEPLLPDDWIEKGAAARANNYKNWNITRKGLLITFDVYQVGPYASGPQQVVIPYSALKEMVNADGPVSQFLR